MTLVKSQIIESETSFKTIFNPKIRDFLLKLSSMPFPHFFGAQKQAKFALSYPSQSPLFALVTYAGWTAREMFSALWRPTRAALEASHSRCEVKIGSELLLYPATGGEILLLPTDYRERRRTPYGKGSGLSST